MAIELERFRSDFFSVSMYFVPSPGPDKVFSRRVTRNSPGRLLFDSNRNCSGFVHSICHIPRFRTCCCGLCRVYSYPSTYQSVMLRDLLLKPNNACLTLTWCHRCGAELRRDHNKIFRPDSPDNHGRGGCCAAVKHGYGYCTTVCVLL